MTTVVLLSRASVLPAKDDAVVSLTPDPLLFLHHFLGLYSISWLIFLWPLDVAASVLWGARLTAILLFAGFILYEVTEDWRINDWAFRDLEGFAIGLGVGAVAQVLLAVFVGLLISGGAA